MIKRTSEKWLEIHEVEIIDYDGYRDMKPRNAKYFFKNVKITEAEFIRRLSICTIIDKSNIN